MNTIVPSIVAERFRESRIVAFSTGNVYPLRPVTSGGSKETDAPAPVGEYAQSCLGRERVFQYTALDDCTRLRVLRLYPRQNQHSSLHFLDEVRRALPFPIKKLQCDNGSEFPIAFKLAVEAAGIKHRYIKPRRPQQNGKVERSHRIDGEEFWDRHDFETVAAAELSLAGWERQYNHDRFSMALRGRTPIEKLRAVLPDVNIPQIQLNVQ